jgi:hypothetical protein
MQSCNALDRGTPNHGNGKAAGPANAQRTKKAKPPETDDWRLCRTAPKRPASGEDRIRTCEPGYPGHRFSKPAHSTTLPPLQRGRGRLGRSRGRSTNSRGFRFVRKVASTGAGRPRIARRRVSKRCPLRHCGQRCLLLATSFSSVNMRIYILRRRNPLLRTSASLFE